MEGTRTSRTGTSATRRYLAASQARSTASTVSPVRSTSGQVPARVLSRDVDCRGCLKSRCPQGHHRCIADVAPAEAVDAALSLLGQPRGVPSEPLLLETLA